MARGEGDPVTKAPLYRWPDGSQAVLESVEVLSTAPAWTQSTGPSIPGWARSSSRSVVGEEFRVVVTDSATGKRVTLYPHLFSRSSRMYLRGNDPRAVERVNGPFRRKLLGLLLDLGVERPSTVSSGLLATDSARTHLRFPKFVADEVFDRRYEEAEAAVGGGAGLFLGCVEGFRLLRHGRPSTRTWSARWHSDNLPPRNKAKVFAKDSEQRSSVREVVDEVVAFEDVRPESARAAFLSAEVEFGENVLWTKDEAEVYQLLGDPLPVFWEAGRLSAWLGERG